MWYNQPAVGETLTFDPRFLRTCTFATLHTPGYGCRVTLFNGIRPGERFATPMLVSLSAFDGDGALLARSEPFLELPPGGMQKIAVDEILHTMAAPNSGELRDVLGILHLVPERLVGREACEITAEEIFAHMVATDDFVEYFSYAGDVVTGVAYQTGPMNDARLSSTRSTMIQAPKVIVSDRVDTLFLLMNVATSYDYDGDVTLRFRVLDRFGDTHADSAITVPAFSFRMLSMRSALEASGQLETFVEAGGLGTLFGLATDGTLVPLSMTRNDGTGAIAVDHTLPPSYYVSKWGGKLRLQGNDRLREALFAREPQQAPAR